MSVFVQIAKDVFLAGSSKYKGTRLLTVGIVIGVIIGAALPSSRDYLAVNVDTVADKKHVWKLLSAPLYEQMPAVGLLHIFISLGAGAFLESSWGFTKFIQFVVLVGFLAETCTMFTMSFLYYLTFDESYWLDPICGFSGVAGGFCIGVAQLMGRQRNIIPGVDVSYQYFPLISLVFTTVAYFVFAPLKDIWLVSYGMYFGWVYLRFFAAGYRPNSGGAVGDTRPEFALSELFPPLVRAPVRWLSVATFKFFTSIGCCAEVGQRIRAAQSLPIGSAAREERAPLVDPMTKAALSPIISMPATPEQQRKREKAIQAIEDRLRRLKQENKTRQGSLIAKQTLVDHSPPLASTPPPARAPEEPASADPTPTALPAPVPAPAVEEEAQEGGEEALGPNET